MLKKILALLIIIVSFTSCATPNIIMYHKPYPPKSINDNIDIFHTSIPNREYVEIAQITCNDTDENWNISQIKIKAKELGADALIIVGKSDVYTDYIGYCAVSTPIGIKAIAIKYKY